MDVAISKDLPYATLRDWTYPRYTTETSVRGREGLSASCCGVDAENVICRSLATIMVMLLLEHVCVRVMMHLT